MSRDLITRCRHLGNSRHIVRPALVPELRACLDFLSRDDVNRLSSSGVAAEKARAELEEAMRSGTTRQATKLGALPDCHPLELLTILVNGADNPTLNHGWEREQSVPMTDASNGINDSNFCTLVVVTSDLAIHHLGKGGGKSAETNFAGSIFVGASENLPQEATIFHAFFEKASRQMKERGDVARLLAALERGLTMLPDLASLDGQTETVFHWKRFEAELMVVRSECLTALHAPLGILRHVYGRFWQDLPFPFEGVEVCLLTNFGILCALTGSAETARAVGACLLRLEQTMGAEHFSQFCPCDEHPVRIITRAYNDARNATLQPYASYMPPVARTMRRLAKNAKKRPETEEATTYKGPLFGCSNCSLLFHKSDLKNCSGCKFRSYCSQECQRAHWKAGHKSQCAAERLQKKSTQAVAAVGPLSSTLVRISGLQSAKGSTMNGKVGIVVEEARGGDEAAADPGDERVVVQLTYTQLEGDITYNEEGAELAHVFDHNGPAMCQRMSVKRRCLTALSVEYDGSLELN